MRRKQQLRSQSQVPPSIRPGYRREMVSVTSLTKEKTDRANNFFHKAANPALRTSLARSSVTELDENKIDCFQLVIADAQTRFVRN